MFGTADGVENVLEDNILVDVDEWDEPTSPWHRAPKEQPEQNPLPKLMDAWF